MLLIVIVTLAATGIGMWLAQFNGFKILGALIIALLIGMVVQFPIRAWYTKDSAERKAGVKDAAGLIANKFLRLGIILLGFKLTLQLLFTTGAKCLPLAAGVVLVTVLITYGICRLMKVDPLMSILVACGTEACSGGLYAESRAVDRTFFDRHTPDLWLPGVPTHPMTFIDGMMTLLGMKRRTQC